MRGAGTSALAWADVARQLGTDQPVYGVSDASLTTPAVPGFASIEGYSAKLADEVQRICGDGPARLAGWSFGGVVAFEVRMDMWLHVLRTNKIRAPTTKFTTTPL